MSRRESKPDPSLVLLRTAMSSSTHSLLPCLLLLWEATWWGSSVTVVSLVEPFLWHSVVCSSLLDIKLKSNKLFLSFRWIESVCFFNDLKTLNINEFECFMLLYNTNHSPKYQSHHWILWVLIKNVWVEKKPININEYQKAELEEERTRS